MFRQFLADRHRAYATVLLCCTSVSVAVACRRRLL